MSLAIRLSKTGKHGQASYKIVVAEVRSKRDGQPLATLGFYNPNVKPAQIEFNQKEYSNWVNKGAQPSVAVKKIISLK
jgi:small subunit ribosomal protein S16